VAFLGRAGAGGSRFAVFEQISTVLVRDSPEQVAKAIDRLAALDGAAP